MKEKIRKRANKIAFEIKKEVEALSSALGRKISLFSLKIGEDPSSDVYRKSLKKKGDKVGVEVILEKTEPEMAVNAIESANSDDKIDGIIIHSERNELLRFSQEIIPSKDVEGITPFNLGKLVRGEDGLFPATSLSVIEIIDILNFKLSGKRTLIIGRSLILGKPLSLLLLRRDATVTIAHSKTEELWKLGRDSDLIIAAAGRPRLVKENMVKEGTPVIDVGINVVNGEIVGDVSKEVREKTIVTPVPGGVGTLTPYMLFLNLVKTVRVKA